MVFSSPKSPANAYGSLSTRHDDETSPILPQVEESGAEEAEDDDEEGENFFHSQRFVNEFVSERFVPLYRTVSEVSHSLIHPSFALSERARDPEYDRRKAFGFSGKSSVASEIANMSKNTIGGGVMSLSGGIALYANDPAAVISATAWILGLGVLFGYFCLL